VLHLNFVASIAERDIDLLLVEEFTVNAQFGKWFISHLAETSKDLPVMEKGLGAWHSVTELGLGESDIVFLFESTDSAEVALLIENKVHAVAQPERDKRYRERGKLGIETGKWNDFRTCLIAPARYLALHQMTEEYDGFVSYEDLRAFFLEVTPAMRDFNLRPTYFVRALSRTGAATSPSLASR